MDLELADEDAELGFVSSLDRKQPVSSSPSHSHSPSPSYFNYPNHYRQHSYQSLDHESDHDLDPFPAGLRTPSLLSSPSVVSSLGFSTGRVSPLRRELSHVSSHDDHDDDPLDASPTARRSTGRPTPRKPNRDALAHRLAQLAQQLTSTNDLEDDGIDALTNQLEEMEKAMTRRKSPPPAYPAYAAYAAYPGSPASPLHRKSTSYSTPGHHKSFSNGYSSPLPRATSQRSASVDLRSRTDDIAGGGSVFSSPASSIFKTRYSDLSASIFRAREPEPEPDPPPKMGMTVEQANKVIAEAMKLNDELTTLVTNLKARQEESDHIQGLLVERAERAAQRIIFLQSRIAHLEDELKENDDELQHLRICLKAVEIQMPPHPDRELQRCIATFKQDYQALKRKRANRNSIASISSIGSPSPSR